MSYMQRLINNDIRERESHAELQKVMNLGTQFVTFFVTFLVTQTYLLGKEDN